MRVSLILGAVLLVTAAVAQVPGKVGYQGRLMKADGTPEVGIVDMTFAIYDVATNGTALGCDAMKVAVSDGHYSVVLGGVGGCLFGPPALSTAVFDGKELYLEVVVAGAPLSPRQRIVSVPYALRAGTAANVRGGTVEATSATIGGASGLTLSSSGISVGANSAIDASGKATVAVGAGLTGDGSTAKPLAVSYGAAAGTAAEGNDARLSDARDPTPGSASYVQNQGLTDQAAQFRISGSGSVGGTFTVGGTLTSSGQIKTTFAGGAPFDVGTNSTVVPSLNAALLGGLRAGNVSGEIPISNGSVNANLNASLLGGLKPSNASGDIPISNGSVNANLVSEFARNNWKQCTFGPKNDDTDNGFTSVSCSYDKKLNSSALLLHYDGNFRIYGANGICSQWTIRIDGNECTAPGIIDANIYMWQNDGSWGDLHRHRPFEGICQATSAGNINAGIHTIAVHVHPCPGYGVADNYTCWNSNCRLIIQEMF